MFRNFFVGAVVMSLASVASAGLLDLSSFADGENLDGDTIFTQSGANSALVTYLFGGAGVAAFDTDVATNTSLNDLDLLVDRGNAFIIQEDGDRGDGGQLPAGQTFGDDLSPADGIFDNGGNDNIGGAFRLDFATPAHIRSTSVIDINSGGNLTVTLRDVSNLTRTFTVPDGWTGDIAAGHLGIQTLFFNTTSAQQSFDNPALFATVTEMAGFDINTVTSMTVSFAGSGAITDFNVIPAPAAAVLAMAGFGMIGAIRRRLN